MISTLFCRTNREFRVNEATKLRSYEVFADDLQRLPIVYEGDSGMTLVSCLSKADRECASGRDDVYAVDT